jgi:hypothetical protein
VITGVFCTAENPAADPASIANAKAVAAIFLIFLDICIQPPLFVFVVYYILYYKKTEMYS